MQNVSSDSTQQLESTKSIKMASNNRHKYNHGSNRYNMTVSITCLLEYEYKEFKNWRGTCFRHVNILLFSSFLSLSLTFFDIRSSFKTFRKYRSRTGRLSRTQKGKQTARFDIFLIRNAVLAYLSSKATFFKERDQSAWINSQRAS